MLRWRLLLGTGIVSILALLCWLDANAARAGVWLFPVALLAMVAGGDEVIALAGARSVHASRGAVAAGHVLIATTSWGVHLWGDAAGIGPFGWIAGALVASLLLLLCVELARYRAPGEAVARLAVGALALLYVGLLMSFVMQLRFVGGGVVPLLSLIVVAKMSDVGAYTVGRLFGRHKLAPLLSPGKTVEGVLGGLLFAVAGAAVVFWLLVPHMSGASSPQPAPWRWLSFALLISLAGMVGDLAESLLKRDVGLKDSSASLPGFGGVLDVLDSLLVAAPVAYFCWVLGLVRT